MMRALKKKVPLFIIFTVFLTTFSMAYSQDIRSLFDEGNQSYKNGEYETALEMYLAITKSGFESGELYYNIGNAYYKMNDVGKAVLNYERARRFMPEDDDLLNNIDLISLSLTDRITPLPEVFYIRYWNSFRSALSLSGWRVVFFAVWLFSAMNVIMLLFIRQHQARRMLKMGLIVSGIIVLLTGAV